MSDFRQEEGPHAEWLSAVVDGQATPEEVARACAAWRDDAEVRERWSTYHLVGDVMRSEDLAPAQAESRDRFLEGFRARLAQEPVVLAPAGLSARHPGDIVVEDAPLVHTPLKVASRQPVAAEPVRRRIWSGPAAVAASFALIVGALVTGGLVESPGVIGQESQFASGGALVGSSVGLPDWTTAQALTAAPVSFHEAEQGHRRTASDVVWPGQASDHALAMSMAMEEGVTLGELPPLMAADLGPAEDGR